MPKYVHIRPAPIAGPRDRVVPLYDGTILPKEGKRVAEDRHVRMLLRDGDVEVFTPEPRKARATKADETAKTDEPTKKHGRAKEQSE